MLNHINFTQLCCWCYSISWIEFSLYALLV